MIVKDGESLEEYGSLLQTLQVERDRLKDEVDNNNKRIGEIKTQVLGIMHNLGSENERMALVLENGRVWDRRVTKPEASLDLGLLEATLGRPEFRKSLCDRETIYTFSLSKLEAAQRSGTVTEEHVRLATRLPEKPKSSLYVVSKGDLKP